MISTATGFSQALEPDTAAHDLALSVESSLGGSAAVGGAILLATAASGDQPVEVALELGRRWPVAAVVGTTFQGLLAGGRVFRDRPALGVIAWGSGGREPVPLILEPEAFAQPLESFAQWAAWIPALYPLGVVGDPDLLLLFPDSVDAIGLEASLAGLSSQPGHPLIAGAAASGVGGARCQAFSSEGVEPGATVGLLVPAGAGIGMGWPQRASASRFASPWLEIGACRERWVDSLDGEPPADWIRRQLAIDSSAPLEPYLDRLLVRIRAGSADSSAPACEEDDFVERFVIGLDAARGSISIPAEFRRGAQLAFALPDAERARQSLRRAVDALPEGGTLLQFACRARDGTLHGDDDMESALVAHASGSRECMGALAPFQIGPGRTGQAELLVHQAVVAVLGAG